MARIASKQVAGYFPSPSALLSSFASILRFSRVTMRTVLVDPCAGEGSAIRTLRDLWAEEIAEANRSKRYYERPRPPIVLACELEKERAASLRERARPEDHAFHADAFLLDSLERQDTGATVLFLNPPYDTDREHGRLEHKFLVRFTRHLHPGAGFLLFLVPGHALAASAEFLAQHYLDIRCWRLPDESYEAFGQVLLVARRAPRALLTSREAVRLRTWAAEPDALPELPAVCSEPFFVPADVAYAQRYVVQERDFHATLEAIDPWRDAPMGLDRSARELLGPTFTTAVPPKPVHTALALAAGIFNGLELEPNDPRRHPPVLAKGSFRRALEKVSERRDGDGNLTATVEIERPALDLTILRLDTYTFHKLLPGTRPTGEHDPARWNTADLIANYTRSLAANLHRQFPAIHDPQDAAAQIALPRLARTPFRAQAQAIQAALKLLGSGRNPFIVAEVGTGKSTIALTLAAALAPEHHAATTAQLERLGFKHRLPVVHRVLVVCPPHLLKSWADQAAAVVPAARVQVLRTMSDLEADAEIYVLSRETAKLGHGLRGVAGRCPRCGAVLEENAEKHAERRMRCSAVTRRAANETARFAERLAAIVAPWLAGHELVPSLVRGRIAQLALVRGPRPLEPERAKAIVMLLISKLADDCRLAFHDGYLPGTAYTLAKALARFAAATRNEPTAFTALAAFSIGFEADKICAAAVDCLNQQLAQLKAPNAADRAPGAASDVIGKLLEQLYAAGVWEESKPCGEPLFGATPDPRRYPLAKLIARRYRHRFSLVVLDEAHEYNCAASAQTKAAHRLIALPGVPTVVLTGSLMGGYASSLFANFSALSPLFRKEFERADLRAFVDRYGYRKLLVDAKKDPEPTRRGRTTDREIDGMKTLGEAPGVLPLFILRHLLPTAVLLHKDDLDLELPPMTEQPAPVVCNPEVALEAALLGEYRRLQAILLDRIKKDRFAPDRAGRLLGALVELPSYLDRATDDLEPFVLCYPEPLGGELIAMGEQFPASFTTPKEAWLLARLTHHIARGERVMVFLRHTGSAQLPKRLLKLIRREVGASAVWLDTQKVPTHKREAWIDEQVIAPGAQVLLVNPNAVRTGLNNLVAFSTAIWYELDYSATTYRQANGRLHRIGQTRPVTIETPYYAATAQQVAFELVASKITASLQVDGLDIEAALEAAGAGEERGASLATALSLGQAVYEALVGRG